MEKVMQVKLLQMMKPRLMEATWFTDTQWVRDRLQMAHGSASFTFSFAFDNTLSVLHIKAMPRTCASADGRTGFGGVCGSSLCF